MIKMNENMLKKIIIDTIKGEQHLGENLKELCVDYIEQLENNWNELKKWLEDDFYMSYYEEDLSSGWVVEIIKKKMQELEQGKDENN